VERAVFVVLSSRMPRVEERGPERCVLIGYGLARRLFLGSMPLVCVLKPNTLIPTAKQEALWAARAKGTQNPGGQLCRTVVRQHTRPGHRTTDASQMAQKAQLRALPGSGPEGGMTSGKPRQPQSFGYNLLCVSENVLEWTMFLG